jgi:hypothetical protein
LIEDLNTAVDNAKPAAPRKPQPPAKVQAKAGKK